MPITGGGPESSGVPAINQDGVPAGIDQLRLPALIAAAADRASTRFLEFFVSTIRNPHTRRAYARAVARFTLAGRDASASLNAPLLFKGNDFTRTDLQACV